MNVPRMNVPRMNVPKINARVCCMLMFSTLHIWICACLNEWFHEPALHADVPATSLGGARGVPHSSHLPLAPPHMPFSVNSLILKRAGQRIFGINSNQEDLLGSVLHSICMLE
jgi:hypothetical protein